ncbi:hypothetical protein HYT33_04580 [Candidatus Roizmanbacteria bacterium]|nr:hypothetical protein [Candidatus Roizmanbacteria bacterium]
MFYFAFILLSIFFVLFLFASPRFSPIPYFPTSEKDLSLVVGALSLKNNQVVYDLGAGGGIVIFEAANVAKKRKLNTQFVAVEINPVLVLILHLKRLLHSNKRNINIVWGDMFKIKFKIQKSKVKITSKKSKTITVYVYVSPWMLENMYKKLKNEFHKFRFVSYFYPLPKGVARPIKTYNGKNKIFIYDIA